MVASELDPPAFASESIVVGDARSGVSEDGAGDVREDAGAVVVELLGVIVSAMVSGGLSESLLLVVDTDDDDGADELDVVDGDPTAA